MALEYVEQGASTVYPEGFLQFDKKIAEYPLSREDAERFGEYDIVKTYLMETPADIREAGWVLTNPSQIERVPDGPHAGELFAYFRAEPSVQHLGHTLSIPYLIKFSEAGSPYLEQLTSIATVPGEDPRVIQNVPYTDEHGEMHVGWCVTTVIATPVSETIPDPSLATDEERETVDHIDQVFYCGPSLNELKEVVRVRDLKNANPSPFEDPDQPGRMLIDIFGRPKPHITYCGQIADIRELSAELIESGIVITHDYLPEDTHTGVNTSRRVPGDPNTIELDIHDACAPKDEDGRTSLHYRLGRAAYERPSKKHPLGIFKPLGVIACRGDFAYAEPKPPEGEVADYYDVLYGSKGNTVITHPIFGPVEVMVTGMSDTTVGIALLQRENYELIA